MIFAKAEGDGGPVLVIGCTFEELRTMLNEPGRSVAAHGLRVEGEGPALDVILFADESDAACRAVLNSYVPGMTDVDVPGMP